MPTSRNSAPVVRPCDSIVNSPPEIPWLVSANVPSTTKPRCAIDEKAMIRFRFGCIAATMAP